MVTIVRLRGIKRVKAKGRVYLYHRASGTRLLSPPGSPALAAELEVLNRKMAPAPRPGTLGGLIRQYKESPELVALAARTRRDYDRVFDWLRPLHDHAIAGIDTPGLVRLRDLTFNRRKRRFANYVITVLGLLFRWAKPRGLADSNPAADVPAIRRPRGLPKRNRAWRPEELTAVLAALPAHLRLAVVIGAATGLREGDVLRLPWSAWNGKAIEWAPRKTGNRVIWIPATPQLRAALDAAPRRGPIIVATRRGGTFTESGFRASFFRVLRRLRDAGAIGPGLTFHGLRATLATRLADKGNDTRSIMAVTGHATESQVAVYTDGADRRRRAGAAIASLEREDE